MEGPGRQTGREASRQGGRGREAGRGGGRQPGREGGGKEGREGGREAGRQAGRQAEGVAGSQAEREGGRKEGREGGKQAGRQAEGVAGSQAEREGGRKGGRQAGRQAEGVAGSQAEREGVREGGKDADSEGLFTVPDQVDVYKLSNHFPVKLLDNDISPSDSVRNLGVIFDSDFSCHKHVSNICKSCFYYHIRDLRRIRRHIPFPTAKTISNALISRRIDYCKVFTDKQHCQT